uniref:FMRFamide-9/10/11/12 n=2 Tax=Calliphoridae TaxID=7371 RepID=FAR9_LUCCU|nr:RecName: Full=CalliFMRFamide-3 [Calliphora vomitoria]P85456.1 RecName: Full=FMRFamide-9/10/11/12; AltName: Full=LucFMRFamide-10; AltName: Full=LucFMRFamide-11; AltName: Full=LucFMRFamide-12; AltName: Full=LucFMRFamide-9 [Lucilia cuprina]
SPSQDFMRF